MSILSEVSQTEKDKYMMLLTCVILKTKWCKWTYIQKRNRPTDIECKLMVTNEGTKRGITWEFGISWSKLLYIKYITSKDLLWARENILNILLYSIESEKEYIHIYSTYMYKCVCVCVYMCVCVCVCVSVCVYLNYLICMPETNITL